MRESQLAGMKKRPRAGGLLRFAIHTVTNDGMTDRAQMQANLMLTPGIQFNFEERSSRKAFQDTIVGDGMT
jgi:hypothetical protein